MKKLNNLIFLPNDIKKYIISFIIPFEYKLLDWIDPNYIDINGIVFNHNGLTYISENKNELTNLLWNNLSYNTNPDVINFLLDNNREIYLNNITKNNTQINFINKNIDKICLFQLISNSAANYLTKTYVNNFIYDNKKYFIYNNKKTKKEIYESKFWYYLSLNEGYINLLKNNINKINWISLSRNEGAKELLLQNFDKIYWQFLSENKSMIEIIEKNLDKVDWITLSKNENAIHILQKNMDKINYKNLSLNPNGIEILKNNQCNIYNFNFSKNPSIFIIDYDKTLETINNFLI
jgi:hypothetical protein